MALPKKVKLEHIIKEVKMVAERRADLCEAGTGGVRKNKGKRVVASSPHHKDSI